MIAGADSQIKRGLDKDYVPRIETKNCPTGKIDISSSIKDQSIVMSRLVCNYDEFTVNVDVNKILKTALNILIKDKEVSLKNKKQIKKNLVVL